METRNVMLLSSKGKKKEKKSAKTIVRELGMKLSKKEQEVIMQTLLPSRSRGGSACLSPSMVPARAQASHLRLEHIFESVPDNFTVCFKPTLYPVSATTNVTVNLNAFGIQGAIDLEGNLVAELYSGDENNGTYELAYLNHSVQFEGKTCFLLGIGPNTTIEVPTIGWPPGQYRVFMYDTVAQAWVDYGVFVQNSTGAGDNKVPFTSNANSASALAIVGDPGEFVPGPAFAYLQVSGGVINSSSQSPEHTPIRIQLPEGTERYRITALGCLLTFFGSTLNDQGGVAMARTYPGWTPFDGTDDPWDAIASLPFQSYDSRLEKGAYAFWLPTDVSELDFREVNTEFTSLDFTRIWASVKGADPSASLRVELDMIIEFYSPLPYFAKDPVPYFSDKFGKILFDLGNEDCVGDNPGHLARIASIGKKVASGVKTAGEVAAMFV